MQKQNEMMDLVWLLNAAANSAFETKELYLEFLQRKQDFLEIRQNLSVNKPQHDYLEQEICQNMVSLKDFQEIVQEVIKVLQGAETELASNEQ